MRLTAIFCALVVCIWSGAGAASPLTLNYWITDTGFLNHGHRYSYRFKLLLDDHDGSWVPGQEWDWIVFGDPSRLTTHREAFCPVDCDQSKIINLQPGWHADTSYGGNFAFAGPTIDYGTDALLPGWQPIDVGNHVSWNYLSDHRLGPGELFFSTVIWSSGATPATFEVASQLPDPSSWFLLTLGFGLTGATVRRTERQRRRAALIRNI